MGARVVCGSIPRRVCIGPSPGVAEIPEIDHTALAARLAAGGALLVDVREGHGYRPGHVPTAVNLPLSVLPAWMAELPTDRPVYVICRSGGRSAQATALMRAVGIDATSVAGGTDAWTAGGHPVQTA